MKRAVLASALLTLAVLTVPRAQMRVVPLDELQGHVALGLALRHLANTGIAMNATAHPDDENNALLVMLGRGHGFRTALATATRGNGGQNEIGPEIFEALGVLRTQELAAIHRFDGAEQYFTRAVDFGYSFSNDETFEKWGRDEIISDFVHLIRLIRPDVVFAMSPTGGGGGQHHQASAVLSHEAYKFAGDPTKYPEQIKAGLRAWQPKKFYFNAGGGPPGAAGQPVRTARLNLAVYDPLLGKTYAEIGTEARSMHKCQGQAQLLSLPGPSAATYQLVESTIPGQRDRDESSLFDGVDHSIAGLAQFAGARPPKELTDGLAALSSTIVTAQRQFDADLDQATLQPLLTGLRVLRALRAQLPGLTLDTAARYEIDFRLRQKEEEFQQAIVLANGVRLDVLADDGMVIAGQPVKVSVVIANRGAAAVSVARVKLEGFDAVASCTLTAVTAGGGRGGRGGRSGGAVPPAPVVSTLGTDQTARCEPTVKIPPTARPTEPYWHRRGEAGRYTFDADAPFGVPFRPTPFRAQIAMTFPVDGGSREEVIETLPVKYRYEGNIFSGEKRSELLVVPAFSVRMTPEIAIVPAGSVRQASASNANSARSAAATTPRPSPTPASAGAREVRVTVMNHSQGSADSVVKLDVPQGWKSTPAEQSVKLTRADEAQTVRFQIEPPANTVLGEYHVRAIASSGGRTFARGYQVIEYPHIRRSHIYHDADTRLKVIDVSTAPNLIVGYIMGVGDQVPPAIEQLGARVEMIDADTLAWGNLARFDTIVTGVRAYERRDDLRAHNRRLIEYVENGGTLIVQYNKLEFNEADYGPYPAKVSNNRVTDEGAPVQPVVPDDAVFQRPNRIGQEAWKGWVQERGLYFLGEKDPRYVDLVQLEDPFPSNSGAKRGALVSARVGKGRWIYVGLGLWRQLPAGTDGAYQLLANLISLGKTGQ